MGKKSVKLKFFRMCPRCGTMFSTNVHDKVYCSKACKDAAQDERRRAMRKAETERRRRASEWINPSPDIPV